MVSVVWATVTVQKPRSASTAMNSSSSDSPVMTSGITSGACSMPENSVRPETAATRQRDGGHGAEDRRSVAEVTPTRRLIQAASIIARSLKNSVYQRVDQPPHTVTRREALNE